jgi:hypothetical protein
MENSTNPSISINKLLIEIQEKQAVMQEEQKEIKKSADLNSEKLDNINSSCSSTYNNTNTLMDEHKILLEKLADIEKQNVKLKHEIIKCTPDKIISAIGKSFLLFSSFSIIIYYFYNYELLKIVWAKIGLFSSILIILIAYFVGKMFHTELEDNGNAEFN